MMHGAMICRAHDGEFSQPLGITDDICADIEHRR